MTAPLTFRRVCQAIPRDELLAALLTLTEGLCTGVNFLIRNDCHDHATQFLRRSCA